MVSIVDLPDYLLQRLFAQVIIAAHGTTTTSAIPATCRQWRAIWVDDSLWSDPALHLALGSASIRASAAAAHAAYNCGWQSAWHTALDLRRNWLIGPSHAATPVLHKEIVTDSDGLTSLDCDTAFRRVAVGCFARAARIYALPRPQSSSERGVGRASAIGPVGGLQLLCALSCHTDTVWDVRWHGDDQLITGSFDGTIALHDITRAGSGKECAGGLQPGPLLTMSGHADRVMGVFSCGTNLVASASRDGTVRRWDVRTPGHRCVAVFRDSEAQQSAYCVTQAQVDEHSMLSGHDGTVAVWDARRVCSSHARDASSGEGSTGLVVAVAAHTRMVMDLQLDEALQCLATASRDDTTKLWHWPSMSCATVLTGQVGVRSVQFDSEKICTAANDRSVAIWKYPAQAVVYAADVAEPEPANEDETGPLPAFSDLGGVSNDDDDGGGTQRRPRAITPPRTVGQDRECTQGMQTSSLSPLRTTATSGVEHRPLYTLKHSAQVPRARFRTSRLCLSLSTSRTPRCIYGSCLCTSYVEWWMDRPLKHTMCVH